MITILVIHIILPTQTIHHFSPNHWKITVHVQQV